MRSLLLTCLTHSPSATFNTPSDGSDGELVITANTATDLRPDGLTSPAVLPRPGGFVVLCGLLLAGALAPWVRAQSPGVDDFNPGANGRVYSMVVQADGKIVVGGEFTTLGGESRDLIGRLNGDGAVDSGFNPGAGGGEWVVLSLAVQADGKIVVGGSFTTLGGQARTNIGRLNADGTVDSGFNPGASATIWGHVSSLAVQADGKIVVGGYFATLGGQARRNIGRLNADGTVDSGFNPGADSNGNVSVSSLAVQVDGKILVGGYFATLGGQARRNIGRLNANGTLDSGFNPGGSASFGGHVSSLAVQADGRIVVGGGFTTLGGQTRKNIGRLHADGSLDIGFSPEANDSVSALALQVDGKILVGGGFRTLGGGTTFGIGRLNADGTRDSEFNTGALGGVRILAVQADGKIVVGGGFTTLGGQTRRFIGRLNSTAPATQSLSHDGSTITWLRGGSSPEVWRTTFDSSTDGNTWVSLGSGSRVAGGWELGGISVPSGVRARARGYWQHNGAAGIVETFAGPPVLLSQPVHRTNDVGTTVQFSVYAVGSEPLTYLWHRDGSPLSDGGKVWGAASATLTVTNVLKADEGAYSVRVSNAEGTDTSSAGSLVVRDPIIVVQPAGVVAEVGGTATLSVTAIGTEPLKLKWWKDGVVLSGATGASLTLTNLQGADAGIYRVEVSNLYGTVTSEGAVVTVNLVTVDSGFNSGADGSVESLALQVDGKIVVGGQFTTLGGQARNLIGRLNADGTLDSGFNPGASGGDLWSVLSLAVQADGKLVVGGSFTKLGGETRMNIGRLNADGTLDSGFNPGASAPDFPLVWSLAVQADGKIVVGGYFTTLGGQARTNIGRLNADGTVDSGFNPGADSLVRSLAVQADGKVVVGGYFTTLGGQPRNYIGRLNPDGTLDLGFNPGVEGSGNVSGSSLAVQADGKIVVGGEFTTLGGQPRNWIGRLNPDGTLDLGFNPGAGTGDKSGGVTSLAVLADGKIVVGGDFRTLGGQRRQDIGRLNADGTLDSGFNPGADSSGNVSVSSLAVQADGRIVVGGGFTTLGGQTRKNIGRLNSTAPASQSLIPDETGITWLRGGSSPDVWRTTFEYAEGAGPWTALGEGSRVAGGWQLAGATVPPGASLRARGYVVSDDPWFVETVWRSGPDLEVATLDNPAAAQAGSVLTLAWSVANRGHEATVGGWVDRVYLSDDDGGGGARLLGEFAHSGVLAPAESLARSGNVTLPGDLVSGRSYWWVVVTDAADALPEESEFNNRRIATVPMQITLALQPPMIGGEPQSQTILSGATATLAVAATGSEPLAFQWYSGVRGDTNAPIPNATATNLVTGALSTTTSYWVRVSNAAGTADSAAAIVTVLTLPEIMQEPASQTIIHGQTASLSVTATGSGPLAFQWYTGVRGDTTAPILGATATNLVSGALTVTTSYWVRVSNAAGDADSVTAMIEVLVPSAEVEINLTPGGGWTLRVQGTPGTRWVVVRAEDLNEWVEAPELGRVEIGQDQTGSLRIPDTSARVAFYRLRHQP